MTEATLEARLVALGDTLYFPRAAELADDVLAAIDTRGEIRSVRRSTAWRRPLLAAAAVIVVLALTVVAVPSARQAVARWFGFDDYRIEPVVDLPDLSGVPSSGLVPGPGELLARTTVDGREVVVMSLPGQLEQRMFTKFVRTGTTTITPTVVDGAPAYWIAGDEHVLMYVGPDGEPIEARTSGDVLVWQRGDRILRVEGDVTLDQALRVAERGW